jgi:hypothetical protein
MSMAATGRSKRHTMYSLMLGRTSSQLLSPVSKDTNLATVMPHGTGSSEYNTSISHELSSRRIGSSDSEGLPVHHAEWSSQQT